MSASSASNVSGGGSASSCTNIAPPQPAVAHLGSDITQKPAVDIGISFGNINNHQGDTINNYYYRTPPGNENADGCQAGTVFGENATTTDQMMRTAYSSGRHDVGTSTDYRTQTRANIRVAIAKAENVLRRLDENGKRMQVVQHKAEGEARRCK